MDAWVFWIIAAVVLAVGEMMTLSFFLAPFAGGALIAALADVIGAGVVISWAIFIITSLVMLLVVRPIARSHRHTPAALRTGTAALIGQSGVVIERIANDEAVGTVKIGGEVWTARAYDDDRIIEAGTRVQVMEIRGATALVSD
jgi:membrane protein implicated in regulation of membrane protease activity